MANEPSQNPAEAIKLNDLFRTFTMYESTEPVSDEIKIFQCEQSDETSSINSALSAMSLRSIANSRCNDSISMNDDVQQKLKRIHQLVASRKELKDNKHSEYIPVEKNHNEHDNDDDDDDEYDEEKGAQLLEKMIASVLKPKSRQKEAFMQNMKFKPDIVTSTTKTADRWQSSEKSDKNGRI